MKRGKLALINLPLKCKKGKDRRSLLVHSRKLAEHDNFPRAVSRRYRDRGQRLENPDRAKNQSDCKIHYRALLEKNKWNYFKRRLFTWLSWQFLIDWGTREPRQIVFVHCTLADKSRQDVLRSSTVRYHPTGPDLVADLIVWNSPHTSWKVEIICPPTKCQLVCWFVVRSKKRFVELVLLNISRNETRTFGEIRRARFFGIC